MMDIKKISAIAFFGILFAFIGIILAQTAQYTADIANSTASGINLSNITVNNGSISINESQVTNLTTDLNGKVNKTGDNITGKITINTTGISAQLVVQSVQPRIFLNETDATATRFAIDGHDSQIMFTQTDITGGGIADIYTFQQNGLLSIFSTYPRINFIETDDAANKNFRVGVSGTDFLWTTVDDTGGGMVDVMRLEQTGRTTLPFYAGSGNAYACFDSSGKLYRSSIACV